MERIRFITHGEHRILLHDFSDCDITEFAAALRRGEQIIRSEPDGPHLILIDVTGLKFEPAVLGAAKGYMEISKDVVKAVAVVGLSMFQESMVSYAASVSKKQISAFRDHGTAKDWLVVQAE